MYLYTKKQRHLKCLIQQGNAFLLMRLTVFIYSGKEFAMSRDVTTAAMGNPFPMDFPKVRISGTTPYP